MDGTRETQMTEKDKTTVFQTKHGWYRVQKEADQRSHAIQCILIMAELI